MILKRLLTEFLLYVGVAAPPGLVAARFAGMSLPRFLGAEMIIGFSTAALLGAFILADHVREPATPARAPRRTRTRRAPVMMPAREAFTTPAPRSRSVAKRGR